MAGRLPPAAALFEAAAEVNQPEDGTRHRREDAGGQAVLVAQDAEPFETTNAVLDVNPFFRADRSLILSLESEIG